VPLGGVLSAILCLGAAVPASAQEHPYFVTYDHYLEERGNLEIAVASTTGLPKNDNSVYTAPWLELEYGLTGWWTTELYIEGVTTTRDGGGFTGWRIENRFRPLREEHAVNPVLYVEYENTNEASRIQKEIVGAGAIEYEPIADLRATVTRELEAKLILSSAVGGWNIAENVVFEKNLSQDEGVEFGYCIGVARPLGGLARGTSCRACRENVTLGAELYGGLGSTEGFESGEQRHYLAPVVGWQIGDRTALKASAGFGLTRASDRYLFRFGISYELPLGSRR
jgi:hypothetical protein